MMLAEVIVASVASSLTIITVASLRFAKWFVAKEDEDPETVERERLEKREALKASFAEERRILNEQRAEWKKSWDNGKNSCWDGMVEIDRQLIALAKEEAEAGIVP